MSTNIILILHNSPNENRSHNTHMQKRFTTTNKVANLLVKFGYKSSKNIGLSVSIVSMLGLGKLWVNKTHINTVHCIYKGDTD